MNELERKLPMKTADFVFLLSDIESELQEHFVCFALDGQRRLVAQRVVFIGTLTGVLAHPREVFAHAVKHHAASIVVAHNHPSDDVTPSSADITTTQSLAAAGIILGIPLSDHIIVAKSGFYSFRGMGML